RRQCGGTSFHDLPGVCEGQQPCTGGGDHRNSLQRILLDATSSAKPGPRPVHQKKGGTWPPRFRNPGVAYCFFFGAGAVFCLPNVVSTEVPRLASMSFAFWASGPSGFNSRYFWKQS